MRCNARFLLGVVGVMGICAAASAETIGTFDIVATPTSASLVAGGGGSWGWLNVANVAIGENEAFTGFSVIDDGFANGPAGTTVEMTFAVGTAVNQAGDDLVLFDGRFSDNSYAVSTDFDGFTAEILLPDTVFIDTGESRSYFFVGTGPFDARVMAAAIDLSALGVPAGGSVTKVRVRGTSGEVDPLGLGSLVPEPATLSLLAFGAFAALRRRR